MSIFDNVAAGYRLNARVGRSVLRRVVEGSLVAAGLLDEVADRLGAPSSALDPTAAPHIEELIRQLRGHYTIVLVTYNVQQAARVARRTAFLLAEAGDPGTRGPRRTSPGGSADARAAVALPGRSCRRSRPRSSGSGWRPAASSPGRSRCILGPGVRPPA